MRVLLSSAAFGAWPMHDICRLSVVNRGQMQTKQEEKGGDVLKGISYNTRQCVLLGREASAV